jgi:hypothetical protein
MKKGGKMTIFQKSHRSKNALLSLYLLASVSILGLMSACAVQTVKIYPDFVQQKQKINTMTILCDYYVVDDVKGKVDLADVPRNLEAAKTAMDALDAQLAGKGYKIVGKEVASMGLYEKNSTKTYKLATEKSPASKEEIEKLPIAPPPFYVNKSLCDSEEKVNALGTAMMKLSTYTRKAGQPATTIPEATQIRTGYNEDAILFLFMRGRDVPLGKSILEGTATAVLSLGMFSAYHVSYAAAFIYMVDSKTGEIIWSDGTYGEDMHPSAPKTHSKLFSAITKGIPAR